MRWVGCTVSCIQLGIMYSTARCQARRGNARPVKGDMDKASGMSRCTDIKRCIRQFSRSTAEPHPSCAILAGIVEETNMNVLARPSVDSHIRQKPTPSLSLVLCLPLMVYPKGKPRRSSVVGLRNIRPPTFSTFERPFSYGFDLRVLKLSVSIVNIIEVFAERQLDSLIVKSVMHSRRSLP